MYIKVDDNLNISNMDELLSFVRECNNTSSLITLLSELQGLIQNNKIYYGSAIQLQASIKAQIDAINNGYMVGKTYINRPVGARPTSVSGREGTINIILLLSGIVVTSIMYALLIFARFIK